MLSLSGTIVMSVLTFTINIASYYHCCDIKMCFPLLHGPGNNKFCYYDYYIW